MNRLLHSRETKVAVIQLFRDSFVIVLVLLVILRAAAAKADNYTVSYTTYDATYDGILKMYIKVLNNYGTRQTGRHDLFNDMIIADFDSDYDGPIKSRISETKNRVGYCIYDLNNDGIEELIIGEDPSYVFEVYTMDNGRIRELIRAGYKYNCALLEGGRFFRIGKDGAVKDSFTLWNMNGTEKVSFREGYIRDGQPEDPALSHLKTEMNFFRMTDQKVYSGTPETLVSTDQFLEWMKGIDQSVLQVSFIPLSLYEQGIGAGQHEIGIISVDGKTHGNATVRLRAKASPKSKVLKNCRVGTSVIILGEQEGYYNVRVGGQEGYIQKEYLTLQADTKNGKRYHIGYENYKEWINTVEQASIGSLTVPPKATQMESSPQESSSSSESKEEYVIDHYETVEVQRSRQVIDHYETYYTYSDNGDGTFVQTPHERPVYTTEYYTESVQKPVYRKVGE